MTGYDVYKRACAILGFSDIEEGNTSVTNEAVTHMINQICADLKIEEFSNLSQNASLNQKEAEALTYGCAMLLNIAIKDNGCASVYTGVYNAKRAAVLNSVDKRHDVLPNPYTGGELN